MTILKKVIEIVEEINSPDNRQKTMRDRQARLRVLVDKYDIETVAVAGGYAASTLAQYIRVKNPSNIGEESVAQAEYVLKQL